jgi:PGF-pre-PGF domain-containing protein
MNASSSNVYYAEIGPFATGTTVTYSIEATDTASKTSQSSEYSFNIVALVSIDEVSSGETEEISGEELEGTGVDSVAFTAAADLTDVQMTVEKLVDKPEEIIDNPVLEFTTVSEKAYVYLYLDLNLTSGNETLGEGEIESITISFKVDKEWLDGYNISYENVILLRYYLGQWIPLNTTITSENDTYVFYEAITTGTSTFVIIGSAEIPASQPPSDDQPGGLPVIWIVGAIIAIIILVIAFLFKSGFLYLEKESTKGKKKKY